MNLRISLYNEEMVNDVLKQDRPISAIIGFKEISRFFSFSKEECLRLSRELKLKGHKVYLQWDILMTEEVFGTTFYGLKGQKFFETQNFDGMRVQDPGLLYALKEMSYDGEVHFIAENGNHNLRGLKSWVDVWPEKISSVVLSPQIPAKDLLDYAKSFGDNVDLEVLGMGPILLFYTPRRLVSPLYGDESEVYHVQGTSEESPHKGFPIIENLHGTFMLNTKDQFIFDELVSKQKILINEIIWRVDPICGLGELKLDHLMSALEREEGLEEVKDIYGRALTKGFFRVNKTDVLFKKLKNHRLQDRDESFIGEVVDVKKKKHIAVWIKSQNGLKVGDSLRLMSPEGREKLVVIDRMTNGLRNDISSAAKGQIAFIPPVGGISVKTMVYLS